MIICLYSLTIGKFNIVVDVFAQRLARLDRKMSSSTLHGLALSSQRNFKTHVSAYVTFCTYYGLNLFPADELQTRQYVQHLSEFHKSVDSSKGYVSSMKSLHEIFGFTPPSTDHLYQLTVNGIRRDKGHVVCQSAPVTPQMLADVALMVNTNDGVQLASWVAILAGFYLLFRKSNLVPDTCVTFSPHRQLTRSNFVRMKDCYVVKVYWSKTIQFFDRCLEIPLLPNPDLRLCPVFWLDHFFMAVPGTPHQPVFSYVKDGMVNSVSYPQLSYWLKEWARGVGYEPHLFSSHSIRRGAQWAAQSGLPHHMIKLLDDWKSSAYEHYLNMTLQDQYDAMLLYNMSMHTNLY